MNLNELISIFREYVDEPDADAPQGDYPDASAIQFLNMEHRNLFGVVRQSYEDWFGREYLFRLVSGQSNYDLPRDMLGVRRVEFIINGGVTTVTDTSVSPPYQYQTIDEINAQIQDVTPLNLNAKDGIVFLNTNSRFRSMEGYVLWDNSIRFSDGTSLRPDYWCRIYYTPTSVDLHRATAQGGGTNYLNLGSSTATTTLGPIRNINKYYVGVFIEITDGPGKGEIKKIIRHDNISGRIWVDSNWITQPTNVSKYSIVSPIVEDYHELIAIGAAIRAKGLKTEDNSTALGEIYLNMRQSLQSDLETRMFQTSRRVVNTTRYGVWN